MPHVTINRKIHVIDADGQSMGRLAVQIVRILIGKHKADYAPNVDNGDFVKIQNAGKMKLTGRKVEVKEYYHYSGYPGGLKVRTAKEKIVTNPGWMISQAVSRMLPKNTFRARRLKRLSFVK